MLNDMENQKGLRRITGEPDSFALMYDQEPMDEGTEEEEEEVILSLLSYAFKYLHKLWNYSTRKIIFSSKTILHKEELGGSDNSYIQITLHVPVWLGEIVR